MEVTVGLWMLILQGNAGAPIILTTYDTEAGCRVASTLLESHFYVKPLCLRKTK